MISAKRSGWVKAESLTEKVWLQGMWVGKGWEFNRQGLTASGWVKAESLTDKIWLLGSGWEKAESLTNKVWLLGCGWVKAESLTVEEEHFGKNINKRYSGKKKVRAHLWKTY